MKNSIKVRNPKPLFDIISIAQTKDLIQQYNGVINEKTSTGSKKYYLLTNGNTIMLDKYEPAYLFTNKTNKIGLKEYLIGKSQNMVFIL